MISSRQIKGLILASLMLSISAYPAGWFDRFNALSGWKKAGIIITAYTAILGGLTYAFLRYALKGRRYIKKEFDRPAELPHNPTREQQVISTVKMMLDRGIDHNVDPEESHFFIIKGCRFGFCLKRTKELSGKPNNILDRGTVAQRSFFGEGYELRGQYPHPSYRNNQEFAAIPRLIELVEEHTRTKNAAAIAKKTHQFSFQTECHSDKDIHTANFNSGISDIIGAYAAEQDRDVREIPVQQNPFALEEVA